jgi:nucleotide-binding universal stress UspA family protein
MYRHILVPTDGSKVSEQAAGAAIELARALGARLTAVHVVAPLAEPPLECWAHGDQDFAAKLNRSLERRAAFYLDAVRDAAMCRGVACECVIAHGSSPSGQILREARIRRCDLVVMASHGRKGADGLAASETLKVVAQSGIPVLAHHEASVGVELLRPPRAA